MPTLSETIRNHAHPLTGAPTDYDSLLKQIGDARFVLLGEASHGTYEFYRERARITRRLITEKGFSAVVAEADWPDTYRVNCYVRGADEHKNADEALGGFNRFPTWMWRNNVVVEFVEWLRAHNAQCADEARAGFYGMDLYSLHASIEAVLAYLDTTDPEAARRARQRYSCFEHFGEDVQAYGFATSLGSAEPCEGAVVSQLVELQRKASEYSDDDSNASDDRLFHAEQNARLVKNAEEYYRSMFRGRVSSWNLRDSHMADTIDELAVHLERKSATPPKIVVWAHNSHLGDARATEMGEMGEWNVGQLVRDRYSADAYLVGFSTYTGEVTAASDWDSPPRRKSVRPGLAGSYEVAFHETGIPNFMLNLQQPDIAAALRKPLLERAIGVIYRPETERMSHYFQARLSDQFDTIIHFDETTALQPLERTAAHDTNEPPETYPSGV